MVSSLTFLEFFSGAGMARLGLGTRWRCLLANDIDPMKASAYRENFAPADELVHGDIAKITVDEIPERAGLAWASFPCQDLSLAGNGAGLQGGRSGTFWSLWRLLESLGNSNREPSIVALENVCGLLTSRGGKDFQAIVESLVTLNYRVGAVVIDASHFVPQSRPRLFLLAIAQHCEVPDGLTSDGPAGPWHPRGVIRAHSLLPQSLRSSWLWWSIPAAPVRKATLEEIVEDDLPDVFWNSAAQTRDIIKMMTPINFAKLRAAQKSGVRVVGTVYRRTRTSSSGERQQRAEIRFDGLAGCLRTPAGGSSRQTVVIVEGRSVRSRLLSAREAARLMGVPDSYRLPERYNDAYHLAGDGVVVPVVRHLSRTIFQPILSGQVKGGLSPGRRTRSRLS